MDSGFPWPPDHLAVGTFSLDPTGKRTAGSSIVLPLSSSQVLRISVLETFNRTQVRVPSSIRGKITVLKMLE